jgi:hypothetical protein
MPGQVPGPREDAPRDAPGAPGEAAVAATAFAGAQDPVAAAASAAATTGLRNQERDRGRSPGGRAVSPDNGLDCVADGGTASPAGSYAAAGFLEAPEEELRLMSAYSHSPSEYVLLCEAVKNGLDLDRYLSPVRDFTFFPENLDKNPKLNVHISSTKLHRIPGLGRFYIKLSLRGSDGRVRRARAMIDSGAEGIFLNRKYIEKNRLECVRLQRPIPVFNINRTLNKDGSIEETASVQVEGSGHVENLRCFVTELGDDDMILGLPWLEKHNPDVNWNTGEILIRGSAELGAEPSEDQPRFRKVAATRLQRRKWQKEGRLGHASDEIWIAAGFTYSTLIAEKVDRAKNSRTYKEVVPEQYRDFKKVFSEVESERLPEHKPWDHKIDLKPDTPPEHRSKNYPMSIDEQREMDKFLEENVRKGYIQSSQSPFAAPIFFVKKKDGELRFIQDYRWLNEWTVKDQYPLPLSADIINRLAGARFFTKFDVRWGYNNVCIQKGDEWKAAFTTNRGLFEPLVLQLFASRDCRPNVQSRGMACAALRVAARLLRAWRDSHG